MGFSVQNILAVFNSLSIARHVPVNTSKRTVWNFYYRWRPRNLTYHSISNLKFHPVCPSYTLTANIYFDIICRGLCRLCAHSTRFEYFVLPTLSFLRMTSLSCSIDEPYWKCCQIHISRIGQSSLLCRQHPQLISWRSPSQI